MGRGCLGFKRNLGELLPINRPELPRQLRDQTEADLDQTWWICFLQASWSFLYNSGSPETTRNPVSLSLCLCLSLSLSLAACLPVTACLSLCFSVSLSLCPSVSLFLCLWSLCLSVLCLCLSLSLSLSRCLPAAACLIIMFLNVWGEVASDLHETSGKFFR